ncbi:MAG: TRAP transporter large permease [Rhodobiaceae bacterium]|nr:TRAP transporter large permease [Rhodobiaceae bacterium]MCC0061402.1 TRAP transporter large permease [Rhodobiaceae bacterium]
MLGPLSAFFGSLAIGVPVAFALGAVAIGYLLFTGTASIGVVATIVFGGMDSFPLLAIPFFVMAGDLATRAEILPKLIDFARALFGPVRGGLAHVNVASSMFFGGVTGVAVADTAAVGGTLIPAMVRDGYPRGFAGAITAASSVMGAIIPPSVAMLLIIYIMGGGLSVTRLFLAGAVPGLLIGVGMMVYVAATARARNFPRGGETWSAGEILRTTIPALPGLGLPVIVLGGILGGFFTPTEAGAIAVIYAVILGLFYRTLDGKAIVATLLLSAKTSAMVYFLLGVAKLIAWILVLNLVPQKIGAYLQPIIGSREMFLLTVIAVFLVLGFVMEGVASMIMLVPIVAPMARLFGVDGYHLALVVVMTVQIALITPPVSIGLYLVCPIAGCKVRDVSLEVLPFIAVILMVILLVVFFPQVAMFLPRLFGY